MMICILKAPHGQSVLRNNLTKRQQASRVLRLLIHVGRKCIKSTPTKFETLGPGVERKTTPQ